MRLTLRAKIEYHGTSTQEVTAMNPPGRRREFKHWSVCKGIEMIANERKICVYVDAGRDFVISSLNRDIVVSTLCRP